MRVVLMVAIATLGCQSPAFARSCYQPDAPSCATGYGGFDDEDEFDSCKSEMESYQSDVEDYLSCLKRNADEAIESYDDAVSSFNQRARSN